MGSAMLRSMIMDTVANIWTGSDFVGESNCRNSQSAPPFYHGKKKLFATTEFSRKAAGNKNIKTVHDVPLRPETRAVRRLHHSAEAICLVLPRQSSHQCDQSSTPSCGDGVFSDERSSVKLKLVNIWNSKLQALGECTSTHDEESKESNTDFESLTMISQVMPVTKFKTGVGSAMFILKLQDHLPSKLRSLFGVSCHNQSMELEKTVIYIALTFAT
ncbi:hypothetical protein KY290_015440 [Solanum tuberosum]|uniref:Uncharacterized protein n=2 Tax=Solanum tuberosum TaxID=4113 RepID=A0ABQ7VSP2_SOLTU|nr:hypothetical protein KY290_015440 [Solanum tuberosum]